MTRFFRWVGTLLLTLSLISQPATAQLRGDEILRVVQGGATKALALNDAVADGVRRSGADASAFEAVTFAGLTAPAEYVDYIAMIDGLTLPGGATKATIGIASDGTTPIYSYTAGAGRKVLLLTSGQHSVEPVGQLASIRFFQWFETSGHPMARRLRASYRAILIPNANPWAFKQAGGGRLNFNAVNLNRNYDYFWSIYDNAGNAANAKGSAAFSEAESRAIKAAIDANDVQVLIDTHNMGANEMTTDLQVGAPSPWVLGNRSIVQGAMTAWAAATGATVAPYGVDFDGEPLLTNWASYYLTVVKGNRSAVAAIIESNSNLAGGTERVLTDAGAYRYCNMILSIVREHMEQGHRPDQARPYSTFMSRLTPAPAESITTGGTLVDTATSTPIAFDAVYSLNVGSTRPTYRDVVAPTAGYFEVTVGGYLESSGSAEQQVNLALSVDGTESPSFLGSVNVSATSGARIPFNLTGRIQVAAVPDAKTLKRIAVNIRKAGTIGANNPKIVRAYMDIRFTPNQFSAPVPVVPLLP